ncbi:gasdermin-D isoform X4 [Rousettus aegyptiacus]|uniref:gasdermin-D isoform X4 n=1 Tax=Rousettus aegyptiacus TaxID=9407 RepID=UPI00168D4984|nr:gasdermin-D isoform X4 [Rousettus aegyptiacus]
MASAFEGVVRSVVRELDRSRELIPVDSLLTSSSYQPYCLVGRKCSISSFWRPRYTCVNLSMKDILEPNAPEPAVERVGPFHFHDTMDGKLQGSVELAAAGQGTLAGGAVVSGSSSASMNVCMLRVAPNTWEALHQERRLRQPEHKVLQQLRKREADVFVVTEVLQTQAEMEVTRTHKQEGSGQFALSGPICLQGKGQGHLSRKKTVTIPSGSTLAFRAAQLVIGPDWDKKQRTFAPSQAGHMRKSSSFSAMEGLFDRLKFQSDGPAEHWLVPTEDFQGLQMEVRAWARALEDASATLCGQLLGALGQVLWDEPALQALEESLEQGLCSGRAEPLHGPAGAVLECLVLRCGTLVEELAGPVFYLLGALAALSETQHVLLAKALETGALPEWVKLVETLLEQSTPWQEREAISLPSELLESSWGSEAPAWVLLEECGLKLQVGAPQVCWEPEAQGPTCALYACLALLLRLSQLR